MCLSPFTHDFNRFETAEVMTTPVYSSHGGSDDMVRASWGRSTTERLRRIAGLGELHFTEHDGLGHELGEDQVSTTNTINPI